MNIDGKNDKKCVCENCIVVYVYRLKGEILIEYRSIYKCLDWGDIRDRFDFSLLWWVFGSGWFFD